MKTQELVNYILRTGQKGYKDMDDGLRISDEMTRLVEGHINQEVEKRIKERMPSEEDAKKRASNNGWAMYNEMAGFMRCYRWLRSRLLLTQDQKKDKQQVDN